jgi:hypothetical protein
VEHERGGQSSARLFALILVVTGRTSTLRFQERIPMKLHRLPCVWQMVDTVVYTRGAHAIKTGIDFRWYQLNTVSPPNPTGSFAFTTTGTNQQGVTNSGNSVASFLLGQVDTFQIDLQQAKIRPRDYIEEYFLQDDWKASNRLTLNIGARWTLHHPSTEKNNQGAVFNLGTQQLDYVGVDGNSRSTRELHYDNVAPRVGFTYLLNEKTVVRSGFGIVFIDQSGITTPFTIPQFPFIQSVTQKTQDSVNAAFALSHGPSVAPIPLDPSAVLGQSVYTVSQRRFRICPAVESRRPACRDQQSLR